MAPREAGCECGDFRWGVAGLTAACELSKAGHRVALFEKRHTLVGKRANLRWERSA
ncbi:MAG: NAD(P)-binding protein [Dehalococcoidia bacterium]|nr:NAD(P)-binding protein [Dehalococcoidia bacterium]